MNKLLQAHFGRRVAILRKERNLTQEGLSLISELDRSYIGSLEAGQRNPTLTNISKIASALGVDLKTLFTAT